MDISSDLAAGIKLLGSSAVISEECYTSLLDAAVDILTDKPNAANVAQLCNSKGDTTKHAYASLLSLLLEAARRDVNCDALSATLLQDYGLTTTRNDKLIKCYKQNKNKIQASLSNIGVHPPHIVNVTWTLDYCIKASSIEQVGNYLYLIQLHTESCSSSKEGNKIKFLCTQEELQHLVWKLKDAVKHVERISAAC